MFWIALAAAAQIVAPQPQEAWFRLKDTPKKYLERRPMALVWLRLTVRPDGALIRCEIEESSGQADLDAYTCDLTSKRARFLPARLTDGTPTYGVYRVPILWSLEPAFPNPKGDVTLTVNKLPSGVHNPAFVRVAIAVDVAGRVISCATQPPAARSNRPNDPALVPIACAQLLKDFPATPAKDENGRPVSSVQTASVVFQKIR